MKTFKHNYDWVYQSPIVGVIDSQFKLEALEVSHGWEEPEPFDPSHNVMQWDNCSEIVNSDVN